MSYPLPEEIKLPFWGGARTILKRDAMLIKVSTDTGLCGYGPGPAFSRAVEEIDGVIKSYLIGKDPLDWKTFRFESSPEIVKTYYAVEVAILDLVGNTPMLRLKNIAGPDSAERWIVGYSPLARMSTPMSTS